MSSSPARRTYQPFPRAISLESLGDLFSHQTARFGGWRMEEGDDDWTTTFEGQTPAQVKQALEDALAAKDGGDDNPWDELFKDTKPEDVKKALDESRKWESRAKSNKEKADQFDGLAKLITGSDDDDKDPDKLAGELTAAQREARATKIENAVLKSAITHDADPVRLTDSRSFMSTISDLDPTADDFGAKVSDAIKAAVEKDPGLKVTTTSVPKPTRQQGRPSEGKKRRGGDELHQLMRPKASSSS